MWFFFYLNDASSHKKFWFQISVNLLFGYMKRLHNAIAYTFLLKLSYGRELSIFSLTLTEHDVSSLSHPILTPSNMGVPPGIEPVTSPTSNPWSPIACHACDAARPALRFRTHIGYHWWRSRTWNNFHHAIQWVLVRLSCVRVNIFKLVHLSAKKFTGGNKKNMSFLLIPKSQKVWTQSETIGLGSKQGRSDR